MTYNEQSGETQRETIYRFIQLLKQNTTRINNLDKSKWRPETKKEYLLKHKRILSSWSDKAKVIETWRANNNKHNITSPFWLAWQACYDAIQKQSDILEPKKEIPIPNTLRQTEILADIMTKYQLNF